MIKLNILTRDLVDFAFFSFFTLLSKFRSKRRMLYLICERGVDARDNGYHLFKYIKETHPEIYCKYIISQDSPDRSKLDCYSSDVIQYRSLSHFKHLAEATYLISTHIGGCLPDRFLLLKLDKYLNIFKDKKKIFLQHGIIKANLPALFAKEVKLNLFITGAKPEYDYVSQNFGYKRGVVKYTGLCRYDALSDSSPSKTILVMPTWRKYIDRTKFTESEYYNQYAMFLQSASLHNILAEYGYNMIFYPHHEFQSLIIAFKNLELPDCIEIADEKYDVQKLLKLSALLITDYSSVYFDMLYMHKPVLFFQFDKNEFRINHYQRGWLDESKLGPICVTSSDLCSEIAKYLTMGCTLKNEHAQYANSMFELRDKSNCKRVFEAISSL